MSSKNEKLRARKARKYLPKKTRILFVAEAPPLSIDRYFYFEKVERDDWLWIALMKRLPRANWGHTKCERRRKPDWLKRFKDSGCQLIDAVKAPITGRSKQRVERIKVAAPSLIKEIKKIKPKRIVLIKATVHEALFEELRSAGLPVVNKEPLPFPSSGRQKEFERRFRSGWLK